MGVLTLVKYKKGIKKIQSILGLKTGPGRYFEGFCAFSLFVRKRGLEKKNSASLCIQVKNLYSYCNISLQDTTIQ